MSNNDRDIVEKILDMFTDNQLEKAKAFIERRKPRGERKSVFLTKEESLKKLEGMECMPQKYYDLLMETAVVTGTHAYARSVDSEDIDLITDLPPHVFEKYHVESSAGYWSPDGWSSSYVKSPDGVVLNILSFSNLNLLEAWVKTTEMMVTIAVDYPGIFDDKWKRVRIFQAIRDVVYEAPMLNSSLPDFNPLELISQRKCIKCGQRADFFYDEEGRTEYNVTGVCVRCQGRGAQR